MKCKACGAVNEDYLEYCKNCAAPLQPEEGSAPVASDAPKAEPSAQTQASWGFVQAPRWIKPEFDANTVSEDDVPADYVSPARRTAAAQEPYVAPQQAYAAQPPYTAAPQPAAAAPQTYAGEQAYTAPSAPSFGTEPPAFRGAAGRDPYARSAQAPQSGRAPQKQRGARRADAAEEGYFGYDAPKGKSKSKAKGGRFGRGGDTRTILFWGAAGLLLIVIGVFIFLLLRKPADKTPAQTDAAAQSDAATTDGQSASSSDKPAFLGGLFSKSPITKPATIEEGVTADGGPAYIITIYAKNNCTVRFTAGSMTKENPIANGSLKLRVPKEVWIPDEPIDAATVEVYPDITVIDKKGNETPVSFSDPIVIALPTIELSLTEPATSTVTVTSANINVTGTVGDTTAEVFVNDAQLYLDESGNFAGVYTLSATGTQEVNVEARKNGYQIARKTFTAEYVDAAAGTTDPAGATTPAGTAPSTTPAAIPANATAVAYVTTNDLNVRDQGAQTGAAIGKLSLGAKVYVIIEDAGNSWSKIVYNNGEAYVSAQYLRIVAQAAEYKVANATVNTDKLKLRSTSSTSGEILTELANGTALSWIKDAGSDWSMVEYNGMIGYVASQYITK